MSREQDELEKHLYIELARLHREYQTKAKPIIDKLVEIQATRPPELIILADLLKDLNDGS